MAKIIFGGAFDPVHMGHINMANQACIQLNADVIFVPAKISVWKSESIDAVDKINMLSLAIQSFPRFSIDTYEIDSENEITYSIETVKYFVKRYPDDKLYLLIGTDQVNAFHRWKSADEIASLTQIIYFDRPGYETSEENVKRFHMQKIDGEMVEASSTDIRHLDTLNLDYKVIQYIENHGLYYIPKVKSYLLEKRYKHSLSVAHLSYEIAVNNHLSSPTRAYIAGLLHDIGKEIPYEKAVEMMKENHPEYLDLGRWSYHQFLGKDIAEKDFEIKDQEILDAIEYHATGKADMSVLGRIIYAADKIEPTRGFDSSELISNMLSNYETGFVSVLKANIEYLQEQNKSFDNDLTSKCVNYYLK